MVLSASPSRTLVEGRARFETAWRASRGLPDGFDGGPCRRAGLSTSVPQRARKRNAHILCDFQSFRTSVRSKSARPSPPLAFLDLVSLRISVIAAIIDERSDGCFMRFADWAMA